MEGKLLGVYESEKAIVRIYAGPMSNTPEKRKELIDKAAISFIKAIYKQNPEFFNKNSRPTNTDE